jgi:hypothetical protein
MDLITGEKIQLLCDIFIGTTDDLNSNPNITINHPKSYNIMNINSTYDNPRIIYYKSCSLGELNSKIHYFANPFVLVSHNSDENIVYSGIYKDLLDNSKIIKWYSQNLTFKNDKMRLLPIGIANSQWSHGNLKVINEAIESLKDPSHNKPNNIYFYFNIATNPDKRIECYNKIVKYIKFCEELNVEDYIKVLSKYKFAICPDGNGVDTHRLWECFYLKVIPIVLDSDFIRIVNDTYNLPMIILKDWDDIIKTELIYKDFDNSILDLQFIKKELRGELH